MVLSIWHAIRRATRRNLSTFFSIRLNQFFLFIAMMIWGALVAGVAPMAAYPFLLVLGMLVLFPLSSDPLSQAPAVRLEIWPMGAQERLLLRLASLGLSPVAWIVVLLIGFRHFGGASALLVVAVAAQAAIVGLERLARTRPRWTPFAFVPAFPGPAGQLARSHVRQMLSVLDTYIALALTVAGSAFRVLAESPDPAAFPILSLLVALALSTGAGCLFGLESNSALTRYRLLPLRGWQILLAKDTALLAVLFVLLLPLSILPGLTFGFATLGIGHFASLRRLPQLRWRFLGGRVITGVPQALVGFGLGFAEAQHGWPFAAGAAAIWALSLWWAGRRWR
jgi:hypothetical protein